MRIMRQIPTKNDEELINLNTHDLRNIGIRELYQCSIVVNGDIGWQVVIKTMFCHYISEFLFFYLLQVATAIMSTYSFVRACGPVECEINFLNFLNCVLWDMGQVHCGIYEIDLLLEILSD